MNRPPSCSRRGRGRSATRCIARSLPDLNVPQSTFLWMQSLVNRSRSACTQVLKKSPCSVYPGPDDREADRSVDPAPRASREHHPRAVRDGLQERLDRGCRVGVLGAGRARQRDRGPSSRVRPDRHEPGGLPIVALAAAIPVPARSSGPEAMAGMATRASSSDSTVATTKVPANTAPPKRRAGTARNWTPVRRMAGPYSQAVQERRRVRINPARARNDQTVVRGSTSGARFCITT